MESKDDEVQRHHLEVNSQNSPDHDEETDGSEDEEAEEDMLESVVENYEELNESNSPQQYYRIGQDGGRYKRDSGFIDGHQMSADYYQ